MKRGTGSKATMDEIADRQGVSRTTVSFVLRDRDMGISESTREAILREAITSDYQTRPDQRIDSQKTRVLFLVPRYQDIYGVDSYYGRLLAYLASREKATGVQLSVQASIDRDLTRSLYRGICEDRVNLVLPINLGDDELSMVVNLAPVPVISLSTWSRVPCSHIGFDDSWIGREAARQFHAAGHRHAAISANSLASSRPSGFKKEWMKLGCKLHAGITRVASGSASESGAVAAALRAEQHCTALFCENDSVATAMLQAIYAAGLSVPQDISLIGCDDHYYTRFIHPSLSTFRMNEKVHGEQLIEEILRLTADGGTGTRRINNKADFIRRQSLRNI